MADGKTDRLNGVKVEVEIEVEVEAVCLLDYVPATSKVISGRVPTCDSVHS